jgi:SAM-dependent methyltransferase
MYRSLKERGRAAADYYAGRPEYFSLSPAGLSLLKALQPVVKEFCRGRVLDAGAGRGVYKALLSSYAKDYVGMDVVATDSTDVLGDIQRLPFSDGSFDTVFCSQVLEHVPEPALALAELGRVLKSGGYLILSVPHISWLHNEPHDYYRYTPHGLRFLLERASFGPAEIKAAGGLLALLGHIPSAVLVNLTFGRPLLHRILLAINSTWVRLTLFLDIRVEKQKVFALNYVCLTKKI